MLNIHRTKEIFNALSQHFKGKYDFVKYNGRLKNIVCRENEFYFIGLAKRINSEEDLIEFYVANFINTWRRDNKIETFPRGWCSEYNFEIWNSWKRNNSNGNLEINFEEQLNKLKNIKKLIEAKQDYPELYRMNLCGSVSIEFIICLSFIIPNLFEYWKKNVNDDILFPDWINFCLKYKPFLKPNKKTLKTIFMNNLKISE